MIVLEVNPKVSDRMSKGRQSSLKPDERELALLKFL